MHRESHYCRFEKRIGDQIETAIQKTKIMHFYDSDRNWITILCKYDRV